MISRHSRTYNDIFSHIYDTYGWNYYPEYFADQLLTWTEATAFAPKSVLDLGCGSGILCGILSERLRPERLRGMDLAESMISIARGHYPQLEFEIGDMVTYDPGAEFELVTCTYDALNHVLDPAAVGQVFRNVARYLAPGGFFVFDLLRAEESEPVEREILEETEDGTLSFEVTLDENNILSMEIYREAGGKEERVEAVRERIYPIGQIRDMICESGLKIVSIDDHFPGQTQKNVSWIIILTK